MKKKTQDKERRASEHVQVELGNARNFRNEAELTSLHDDATDVAGCARACARRRQTHTQYFCYFQHLRPRTRLAISIYAAIVMERPSRMVHDLEHEDSVVPSRTRKRQRRVIESDDEDSVTGLLTRARA